MQIRSDAKMCNADTDYTSWALTDKYQSHRIEWIMKVLDEVQIVNTKYMCLLQNVNPIIILLQNVNQIWCKNLQCGYGSSPISNSITPDIEVTAIVTFRITTLQIRSKNRTQHYFISSSFLCAEIGTIENNTDCSFGMKMLASNILKVYNLPLSFSVSNISKVYNLCLFPCALYHPWEQLWTMSWKSSSRQLRLRDVSQKIRKQ